MFMGILGVPFLLVVALVLLVLAGKSEPDPGRERPAALYLSALTLLGVLLLLAGTFFTAKGLVELTDTTPTGGWFSYSQEGVEIGPRGRVIAPAFEDLKALRTRGTVNHDDDVSMLIGGVIMAAIAVALLRFHLPKLQDFAATSTGPGARVYNRLLYVVSGASLVAGLLAAGTVAYSIYGMIAPETAGAGRVTDAFREGLSALAVAVVAGVLFREAFNKSDLATVKVIEVEPEPEPTEPVPVKKAARTRKAAPPKE
jgi:hypothetical protein